MSSEDGLDALDQVRQVIASHNLPFLKQRKFNGIFNAMEMQIEDEDYSVEVVNHLAQALLALAKEYDLETSRVEAALSVLQRRLKA